MPLLRARHRRFVSIAPGSFVDRPVRFAQLDPSDRISVGARTMIYRDVDITGNVTIGEDCFINRSAYIRPHTTICDRASLGPFVRVITDWHVIGGPRWRNGPVTYDPVTIGEGSGLAAGVTVLPGVTIGAGALVVAGSVVTKDVPPNVMVGGVPAKFIRALDGPEPDASDLEDRDAEPMLLSADVVGVR
jgi:acetyltransferase-like isoleucine patch superfamily enzyme